MTGKSSACIYIWVVFYAVVENNSLMDETAAIFRAISRLLEDLSKNDRRGSQHELNLNS